MNWKGISKTGIQWQVVKKRSGGTLKKEYSTGKRAFLLCSLGRDRLNSQKMGGRFFLEKYA